MMKKFFILGIDMEKVEGEKDLEAMDEGRWLARGMNGR